MNTGIRLREALNSLGKNIKEAAEASKIPYRSMQNYLRGEREPGAEALAAINEHLGISIDWLLTGEGTMYKNAPPASQQQPALTPKERALLEMFKELSEKDQREICRDAEEKKRLADMELQLKAMALKLEQLNSTG